MALLRRGLVCGIIVASASACLEIAAPPEDAGEALLAPDAASDLDAGEPAHSDPLMDAEAGATSAGDAGRDVDAGTLPMRDAGPPVVDAAYGGARDAMSAGDAERADVGTRALCPDGFPRGVASTQVRQIAALNPSPEGVGGCPSGDFYAGAADVLWRLSLDGGAPEKYRTIPGRSFEGIVCDHKGRLLVADIAATGDLLLLDPVRLPPAILMLGELDAAPRELRESPGSDAGMTGFNGVIDLPGFGVYATDMLAGLIVRFQEVSAGEFVSSVVKSDLPGANGLSYDPRMKILYMSQTGLIPISADRVLAFEMQQDGTLGAERELWNGGYDYGVDGLAIDEHGIIYRANQSAGTVVRMSDEAIVAHVPNPASLAFRGGTMLITDFKVFGALQDEGKGGVYAIDLGVCAGATTL